MQERATLNMESQRGGARRFCGRTLCLHIMAALALVCLAAPAALAQPANDLCADAEGPLAVPSTTAGTTTCGDVRQCRDLRHEQHRAGRLVHGHRHRQYHDRLDL